MAVQRYEDMISSYTFNARKLQAVKTENLSRYCPDERLASEALHGILTLELPGELGPSHPCRPWQRGSTSLLIEFFFTSGIH